MVTKQTFIIWKAFIIIKNIKRGFIRREKSTEDYKDVNKKLNSHKVAD